MKNYSDTEVQALVNHYQLPLNPPKQYQVDFSGLTQDHYGQLVKNVSSMMSKQDEARPPKAGEIIGRENAALGVGQGPTPGQEASGAPGGPLAGQNSGPILGSLAQGMQVNNPNETPAEANQRQQGAWSNAIKVAGQQATLGQQQAAQNQAIAPQEQQAAPMALNWEPGKVTQDELDHPILFNGQQGTPPQIQSLVDNFAMENSRRIQQGLAPLNPDQD
jgi:hypothetical protein